MLLLQSKADYYCQKEAQSSQNKPDRYAGAEDGAPTTASASTSTSTYRYPGDLALLATFAMCPVLPCSLSATAGLYH